MTGCAGPQQVSVALTHVDDLTGKVAVVTGGASGIGRATVEHLHRFGACVVIADIATAAGERLAVDLGERAVFQRTDVASADQMASLMTSAVAAFGGLHIMVNNAAVTSPLRSFLDDDFANFADLMAVNMLGVMLGTQHAARHMAGHGGGSVINMASIGGLQAGSGVASYRASKAGVIHFTRSAAIELARYDIRVNAIAPGHIRTPLLAAAADRENTADVREFEETIRARMQNDRPLKRQGTPDDIAAAVHYLASDAARYITGVILPVDGGTTAGKYTPKTTGTRNHINERTS